ncbi:hypothetical protein HPP92_009832 [Vanilla planifolia]|uniref:Noroxomaritidine/norcraugsodine reductase n=1 Tax=Vanilla planifolia TaxID=51239 RepID=A0A835RKP0_VANPL|nr:hypothetical protein HPP92_010031 [Vanilla planifolia]KAG0487737.1 hypothetical protein HPP92_009832 [Vanilla planifolia]
MAAANPMKLEGKVAIITGGARGIGEAAARLFSAQGAIVVIADVQDALGRSVAASLPRPATFVHCDVRDEAQVATAVAHAVEAHGRLDVLFSNAGVIGPLLSGFLDMDLTALDDVLAVNVRGAAAAIKHAGREMARAGRGGSIVCTASVAAIQGGMAPAGYTAAKHGLLGLAKAAAAELGEAGVRVNCVSPFGVATRLSCAEGLLGPEELEKFTSEAAYLKGAVLNVRDVAEAALFLASDDSAFITGHNLVVDGGVTQINPATSKFTEIVANRQGSN